MSVLLNFCLEMEIFWHNKYISPLVSLPFYLCSIVINTILYSLQIKNQLIFSDESQGNRLSCRILLDFQAFKF